MSAFRLQIALLLAGLLGAAVHAETLDEVEKQIIEKWAGVRSLSAELTVESQAGTGEAVMKRNISGTIEYVLRDGKKLVRQDLKTRTEVNDESRDKVLEGSTLQVCDGRIVWKLADQGGRKVVFKNSIEQEPIPLGGKEALDTLKKDHALSLGKDTSVDGALCWQLIAKPKHAIRGEPAEISQYLRQSDGILVRSIGKDENGTVILTAEYANIRVNGEIPAERFEFKPAPGVTIVDQTQANRAPKHP